MSVGIGTINDALGEFGLVAKEKPALFGFKTGDEIIVGITDNNVNSHGPVLERAVNRFGGVAVSGMYSSLLNKTFLSLKECQQEVVAALVGAKLAAKMHSTTNEDLEVLTTAIEALVVY